MMIYGGNVFNQTFKTNIRTCENVRKVSTGQGDYNTTCFLFTVELL